MKNVTQIINRDQSTPIMETTGRDTTNTDQSYFNSYDIHLQLTNLRTYPVQVEYESYFAYYYRNITLVQSSGDACRVDDPFVKCKFTLRARATAVYSYKVKLNYQM